MAQRNTSNKWTGPSVPQMISTHTLAKEVTERHNDACPVFDDAEMAKLRRFVQEPSRARDLMREFGQLGVEGNDLNGASGNGRSLAGHIMATYGSEKSALTEDEILELRQWFENGGGQTSAGL